ncbi:MAG: RagB/SusD family nutrient uptake outer membrane protein [Prevotellaceae bacterium]|nr:RagB/SusD family nutrient uptake outer membrane protein [Prevotellaceae bacterium]
MKRNTIMLLVALFFVQGITTSCSKWLDVDSSSNILEETLFEDYEGYHTAVNGVYRLLSNPELYGRNLTWGVASVLGNNYDATRLPVAYRQMAEGDYESSNSTSLIDPIWDQGYKVIANCNNIIQYVENQDPTFFPEKSVEKNMITGEMLGVRAMMHFDILRLFAPATKVDDGKIYIPYITAFPDRQPEHLKVKDVLDNVIKDLEQAKTLLAYCDTVAYPMSNYSTRLQTATDFYGLRGTRMNYFAVSAILARAYQWRNGTGDMERAYRAALDVYRFSTERTWYQFTPSTNMAVVEENVFRKMPHDILLAFHNKQMYTIIESASNLLANTSFFYKNDAHLFAGDEDDFRFQSLINADKTSRRWSIPTTNQTGNPTAEVITYQGPLAPVARLSEMVYIMCEYLSETDLPQAIELLGKVRIARGAKTSLDPALTKEDFLSALYIDMTREFMSEGQTFYLYKRLNEPIYNGAVSTDMEGRYVLPLPYSETAYFN